MEIANINKNYPKGSPIHRLLVGATSFIVGIDNLRTQKQYKRVINDYLSYLLEERKTPIEATASDIVAWREYLFSIGNGDNTIENKTSIVSAFYNYLRKPGIDGADPFLKTNPIDGVIGRKHVIGKPKRIAQNVFVDLLKQINTKTVRGLRDMALLVGYYITGRRCSEWVRLRFDEINWNLQTPSYKFIRKGKIVDYEPIPNKLMQLLEKYMTARWGRDYKRLMTTEYIFSRIKKSEIESAPRPLSERYALKLIKNLAFAAGYEPDTVGIHSLRHLHAQSYLNRGASVETIRKRLRHKNISTTQRYINSLAQQQNGLSKVLDEVFKNGP